MNTLRTTLFLMTAFSLAPTALAQTKDWQAVKNLAPGTKISVHSNRHRFRDTCLFQRATDNQLFCEWELHGLTSILIPPDVIYQRKEVREVRLEHRNVSNMAMGAAVGGGIGAAAGAAKGGGPLTRGGGALLIGSIGALVGGTMGKEFPILHGKVIYRR